MNICLFDPGLADNKGNESANLGDLIIQESVTSELQLLFPKANIIKLSTHTYPNKQQTSIARDADFTFVGGTNLLGSRLFIRKQWKISFLQKLKIKNAILMGVGWGKYEKFPNFFSRISLRAILSSKYFHSVRDNYTKKMLEKAGITNVLNTGCPTMWRLNLVNQGLIPNSKSKNVLVMLTDYSANPKTDKMLLELVANFYDRIFFWPQGKQDISYIEKLSPKISKPIIFLDHDYNKFTDFLNSNTEFDYIGTRLHGGIKCLNTKKRSLILKIDNRATEISKDTGLFTVERNDFDKIEKWILGSKQTNIFLDHESINKWKSQFSSQN